MDASRLKEFDFLRAFSIVLLLLHHGGIYQLDLAGFSVASLEPFFEAFLLGCFFFIAGYFAERSLSMHGNGVWSFFRARFFRLCIPYWAALGSFVLILGYSLKTRFDLLVYLAGLQFIFAPVYAKPIITLWYFGAIVLYYLIFVPLRKISASVYWMAAGAVVIFVLFWLLHQTTSLMDERFYKYYFVFLGGMLFVRSETLARWLSAGRVTGKALIAGFGCILFAYAVFTESPGFSLPHIFSALIFIVSVIVMVHAFAVQGNAGSWSWVPVVSYASYFIYLFHRPLWQLLSYVIPPLDDMNTILFRLGPGSFFVVAICYFLQRLYDIIASGFAAPSRPNVDRVG